MGSKSTRAAAGILTFGASEIARAGYDAVQAPKKAEKATEQAMRRQERGQQLLEAQLAEDEARSNKTKAVRIDRAAQRLAASGYGGRRSTLLTGPLGLTGEPELERRTLLGG